LLSSYPFIDASTSEAYEEEEGYFEEEGEEVDPYSNQGKLY